jgi:hypothetical protein
MKAILVHLVVYENTGNNEVEVVVISYVIWEFSAIVVTLVFSTVCAYRNQFCHRVGPKQVK